MSVKTAYRQSASPAIVAVTASWCPHCHALKPELATAASILGSVVAVYDADGEKYPDLARKLRVQGYPTIFFRTGEGRFKKYSGSRDGQAIADWACAQSGACGRRR